MPNLKNLVTNGYFTLHQRNQLPAMSAPNWSTLLTGLPPSDSGIHDNDWSITDSSPKDITEPGLPPITGAGAVPTTVWEHIHRQRPQATFGAVYCWDWLVNMVNPVDWIQHNHFCEEADDGCVRDQTLSWIKAGRFPDFSFIYFGGIDEAGHSYGWGSPEYFEAADKVDVYIGEIIAALHDNGLLDSILIGITADHGGIDKGHGGFDQINMETPLIYFNAGGRIRKGLIDEPLSNIRFLPTLMNAVGLSTPAYMGRPLEIFDRADPVVSESVISLLIQ
jgi:hypothetical protein